MDKYFYFVSQLPFLKFDEVPLITKDGFLEEAAKWITPKNLKVLAALSIDNFSRYQGDSAVVGEYKNFERRLRENLVILRDQKGSSKGAVTFEEVKRAVTGGNPLEHEKNLYRLRWHFIEEQEKEHFFDIEYIKLYFLKLQILETLAEFDKDKGMAIFDQLCESTTNNSS